MNDKRTWIVVADRSRASVYEAERLEEEWRLLEQTDYPPGRARASELVTDQQGSVRQSGTGTLAAMDASTEPTDVELERFARELAEKLQQGYDQRRFGRLVLVAPPRFLGRLRDALSDPVRRRAQAEIDKDYTALELRDLRARVLENI